MNQQIPILLGMFNQIEDFGNETIIPTACKNCIRCKKKKLQECPVEKARKCFDQDAKLFLQQDEIYFGQSHF